MKKEEFKIYEEGHLKGYEIGLNDMAKKIFDELEKIKGNHHCWNCNCGEYQKLKNKFLKK